MEIKKIRPVVITLLIVALSMGSLAAGITNIAQAEEKKEFVIALPPWENDRIVAYIMIDVLEKRFGYKITRKDIFEWGITFSGLATGDIDMAATPPVDFCLHDYWNRFKDKVEKLGVSMFGLYQGLAVPSYVPVDSIEQLNNYKDKFHNKIVGIEAGSGVMRQTKEVIKAYDLDLELVQGSTAGMLASVKSAIEKKEWIVFTNWTPWWPERKWNIKFLDDPRRIQAPEEAFYIIVNKNFRKLHPLASKVLCGIFIPKKEVSKMMLWMEEEGLTAEQVARKWMEQNKIRVDRWADIGS